MCAADMQKMLSCVFRRFSTNFQILESFSTGCYTNKILGHIVDVPLFNLTAKEELTG